MYIFHLDNKKIINLEDDHILCKWSKILQKNNDKNIYLKDVSSNEFKMLIRLMELLMSSKSEQDYIKKLRILTQLGDIKEIKKALLVMHNLQIVPPEKYKVISKIPDGLSLANVIGPIIAETVRTKEILIPDSTPSLDDKLSLILYHTNITKMN